jgi:predicted branched-subunit amino acid permease
VGFGSPRAAWIGGAREALGAPALVLGASYVGFGSLIRQLGLGLEIGLLSTFTAWAAPGQVAAIELHAAGASLASIFFAVALVNARLLPMAVTLTPVMHVEGRARWRIYLAAHLIAITAWAMTMMRAPSLPRGERLCFFVGFAVTLWLASLLGTAIGFAVTDDLPRAVSIALIFINPIYFLLIFFVPPHNRSRWLALGFGAAIGPIFHRFSPGWGLLIAGLVAGSAAFLVDRLTGHRA